MPGLGLTGISRLGVNVIGLGAVSTALSQAMTLARDTTAATGLSHTEDQTKTGPLGSEFMLATDGTLSALGYPFAGLTSGVTIPVPLGTFQSSTDPQNITVNLTGEATELVTGDVTGWTAQGATITAVSGGVEIASNGEVWHSAESPSFAVVAGNEYMLTTQSNAGAAYRVDIRDTGSVDLSAFTSSGGQTINALGPLRLLHTVTRDGVTTNLFHFVPNRTGSLTARFGPNSTSGSVQLFYGNAGLREDRTIPDLFQISAQAPSNDDYGRIDRWSTFGTPTRTDLTADASPLQMPQRIQADDDFSGVTKAFPVVAGERYPFAVVWKDGNTVDQIRVEIDSAASGTINLAYRKIAGAAATYSQSDGTVEAVREEEIGGYRRLYLEFVPTVTDPSARIEITPFSQNAGEYIDLFNAGASDTLLEHRYSLLNGAGVDFDTGIASATNLGVVTQNYVDDSLLNVTADEFAVTMQANSYGFEDAVPAGGVGFHVRFLGADGGDTEGWLTYQVKVDSAFDYGLGGKLPGLMHGRLHSAGSIDASQGWSARMMWGQSGEPYGYVYDADRDPPADSLGFNGGILYPDRWHKIDQRVKLNDEGQANGEIEYWFDGIWVGTKTGIEFAADATQTSEGVLFDVFRGGGDSSWATGTPGTITFKKFDYWTITRSTQSVGVPDAPVVTWGLNGNLITYDIERPDDNGSTNTYISIEQDGVQILQTKDFQGEFDPGGTGTFSMEAAVGNAVGLGAYTAPFDVTVTGAPPTASATPVPDMVLTLGAEVEQEDFPWANYFEADEAMAFTFSGQPSGLDSGFNGTLDALQPATVTTVTATTSGGPLGRNFNVTVASVPNQITDFDIVADGAGGGNYSFSAPANNNSAILRYEMRIDQGAEFSIGTSTSGNLFVGADGAQDFEVRAVNALDDGPWSNLVTEAITGTPTPAAISFGAITYSRPGDGVRPSVTVADVDTSGLSAGDYRLYLGSRLTGSPLSRTELKSGGGDVQDRFTIGPSADILALDATNLALTVDLNNNAFDLFFENDDGGTLTQSVVGTVTGVSVDATPPVITWATSVDGTQIIGTADKAMWGNGLAVGDFSAEVGGSAITLDALTFTDGGTSITLDVNSGNTIANGDVVTVTFTDATGLVNTDGAEVVTFTDAPVTNNVPVAGVAEYAADLTDGATNYESSAPAANAANYVVVAKFSSPTDARQALVAAQDTTTAIYASYAGSSSTNLRVRGFSATDGATIPTGAIQPDADFALGTEIFVALSIEIVGTVATIRTAFRDASTSTWTKKSDGVAVTSGALVNLGSANMRVLARARTSGGHNFEGTNYGTLVWSGMSTVPDFSDDAVLNEMVSSGDFDGDGALAAYGSTGLLFGAYTAAHWASPLGSLSFTKTGSGPA